MISALWLLLETIGSLLASACLLRAIAWWQQLSPRNPIMQFVIAVSDWLVKPLRRVLPASHRVDWASLAGALIISILLGLLYSVLMLARPPMVGGVLMIALFWLFKWAIYLLIGLVLLQAVLSWVNPHAPMAPVIDHLTRPFLAPVRRVVPLIGGVDLSPLVMVLAGQVLLMLLESLLAAGLRLL